VFKYAGKDRDQHKKRPHSYFLVFDIKGSLKEIMQGTQLCVLVYLIFLSL
jgi:hypothetical protein